MREQRTRSVIGLLIVGALAVGICVSTVPAAATESPPSFITVIGGSGSADGQFQNTVDAAVTATGADVYATDFNGHRVQQFTPTGTFVRKWGTYGTATGQFNQPRGIAVHPSSGDVYVADTQNHRVQQFTATGTFVRTWGSYGTGEGQFNLPTGVGISPTTGDVYVTDTNNNRVQQFTATGTFVRTWGSYGTGNNQFNQPYAVDVGPTGDVYVADMNNDRIQVFTATGTFVTGWGGLGSGNGQFYRPRGVAVDENGDVYVGDQSNSRVQRFTSTGTFRSAWGTFGSGNGQFNNPSGVAVDTKGNVYVADNNNHRIQRFGDLTAPTVDLRTPADGATYERDESVTADYDCTDEAGGSGLASCVGDGPDGGAVDTSTLGGHSFSVDADDEAGNTTTVTHSYTVVDVTDPTVDLRTPTDGAAYQQGQSVTVDYDCADEAGGSGLASCVGDVPDGGSLPTGTAGPATFSVTATDQAGNDATVTHGYTVADVTAPTIDLRTPADGATYGRGQTVLADYDCTDNPGGSGIATCVGDVADGVAIDTTATGPFTFRVDATDAAANPAAVTADYTIALSRPDARIRLGTGAFTRDDLYNTTAANQSRSGRAAAGRSVTYYVSVGNDAPFPDTIRVRGQGSTNRFTVAYRSPTNQVVTSRVVAGTYEVTLGPGATHLLKVTVTVRSSAPRGASLARTVTVTAKGDATRKDVVKFTTSRS